EKRRYVGGYGTEDDKYLIISAANTTYGNELHFASLEQPNLNIKRIVDNFDNEYSVIESQRDKLFIVTDKDAPNSKIVVADAKNPAPENWTEFIPETENVLTPTTGAGYFFAHYMKDAI